MDPITAIGLGATAGGGILGAFGKFFEGQASEQSFKYQAGVAAVNKQIAEQNADYAREVGEVQAQQEGMKTRAQIGTTKAIQSASGLQVGTGSAEKVVESEQELGTYDQSLIRANAAKRAYGYDVEAMNLETQRQMYGMAAKKSKTAGTIGAVGSLLGTAGSLGAKWSQGQQLGMFGET